METEKKINLWRKEVAVATCPRAKSPKKRREKGRSQKHSFGRGWGGPWWQGRCKKPEGMVFGGWSEPFDGSLGVPIIFDIASSCSVGSFHLCIASTLYRAKVVLI